VKVEERLNFRKEYKSLTMVDYSSPESCEYNRKSSRSLESNQRSTPSVPFVQVAVRVKPLTGDDEVLNDVNGVYETTDSIRIGRGPNAPNYSFDRVFRGGNNEEEQVFMDMIEPLIEEACSSSSSTINPSSSNSGSSSRSNNNATVLLYGEAGSGKTTCLVSALHGFIPRSLVRIFRVLSFKKAREDRESSYNYQICIQFVEIVQKEIVDLLADNTNTTSTTIISDVDEGATTTGATTTGATTTAGMFGPTKLKVVGWNTESPHISGAISEQVSNVEEAMLCLENGLQRRRCVDDINQNHQHHQAHAIMTVLIHQSFLNKDVNSRINFVDLASPQHHHPTDTISKSIQFRERCDVNKTLMVLGIILAAIWNEIKNRLNMKRPCPSFIPFRDSLLTSALKGSMGENNKILLIACISSALKKFDKSHDVLRFANRIKGLKTNPTFLEGQMYDNDENSMFSGMDNNTTCSTTTSKKVASRERLISPSRRTETKKSSAIKAKTELNARAISPMRTLPVITRKESPSRTTAPRTVTPDRFVSRKVTAQRVSPLKMRPLKSATAATIRPNNIVDISKRSLNKSNRAGGKETTPVVNLTRRVVTPPRKTQALPKKIASGNSDDSKRTQTLNHKMGNVDTSFEKLPQQDFDQDNTEMSDLLDALLDPSERSCSKHDMNEMSGLLDALLDPSERSNQSLRQCYGTKLENNNNMSDDTLSGILDSPTIMMKSDQTISFDLSVTIRPTDIGDNMDDLLGVNLVDASGASSRKEDEDDIAANPDLLESGRLEERCLDETSRMDNVVEDDCCPVDKIMDSVAVNVVTPNSSMEAKEVECSNIVEPIVLSIDENQETAENLISDVSSVLLNLDVPMETRMEEFTPAIENADIGGNNVLVEDGMETAGEVLYKCDDNIPVDAMVDIGDLQAAEEQDVDDLLDELLDSDSDVSPEQSNVDIQTMDKETSELQAFNAMDPLVLEPKTISTNEDNELLLNAEPKAREASKEGSDGYLTDAIEFLEKEIPNHLVDDCIQEDSLEKVENSTADYSEVTKRPIADTACNREIVSNCDELGTKMISQVESKKISDIGIDQDSISYGPSLEKASETEMSTICDETVIRGSDSVAGSVQDSISSWAMTSSVFSESPSLMGSGVYHIGDLVDPGLDPKLSRKNMLLTRKSLREALEESNKSLLLHNKSIVVDIPPLQMNNDDLVRVLKVSGLILNEFGDFALPSSKFSKSELANLTEEEQMLHRNNKLNRLIGFWECQWKDPIERENIRKKFLETFSYEGSETLERSFMSSLPCDRLGKRDETSVSDAPNIIEKNLTIQLVSSELKSGIQENTDPIIEPYKSIPIEGDQTNNLDEQSILITTSQDSRRERQDVLTHHQTVEVPLKTEVLKKLDDNAIDLTAVAIQRKTNSDAGDSHLLESPNPSSDTKEIMPPVQSKEIEKDGKEGLHRNQCAKMIQYADNGESSWSVIEPLPIVQNSSLEPVPSSRKSKKSRRKSKVEKDEKIAPYVVDGERPTTERPVKKESHPAQRDLQSMEKVSSLQHVEKTKSRQEVSRVEKPEKMESARNSPEPWRMGVPPALQSGSYEQPRKKKGFASLFKGFRKSKKDNDDDVSFANSDTGSIKR
jgi:Kinesin motor domain